MSAEKIRQLFLDFFKEKGHTIIPSAPLIPEHDPTVLFTTAGMHPLVPYLLGEKHPGGKRLANVQKCIRTTDIEDVGDNRHLTFFEMLGNWSLGDYFKKEAIEWSWEFLTDKKWLSLEPERIYVTVFMGDDNAPQDQKAIDEWRKQFIKAGIKAEICPYNTPIAGNKNYRIFPLPAKDNWWGPAGQTGPCGPCTEIFYDVLPQNGPLEKTFDEEMDRFRIMEIWNDVFMEFNKTADGKFEKLTQQNVDTGMGVERTVAILNGKKDVFDMELFYPLFEKIEELSGKKYDESDGVMRTMRIVADHLKTATFLLAEGLEPSNIERGYILRRLIRRVIRYGKQLGISEIFTFKVAQVVIDIYKDVYPELQKARKFIDEQLIREGEKFAVAIQDGLKISEKNLAKKKSISPTIYSQIMQISTKEKNEIFREIYRAKKSGGSAKNGFVDLGIMISNDEIHEATISGKEAFNLYQTYGFPLEMIIELAQEKNIFVDIEDFHEEVKKHQQLSRTASAGMFKGGLADHSEQAAKYHTATHLLLAALRQILGDNVFQKGSNITAERLRFDFSHPEKLTSEQIKQVEDLVNQKIQEDLQIKMEEMSLQEAKKQGAMGVFEAKYAEKVKVYTIGNFSKEICGGPHAQRTGELGHFKVVKEEASSAGVRRIKAVLN